MAETKKKTTTKKTTTSRPASKSTTSTKSQSTSSSSTTHSSSSNKSSFWGLNKISFYTVGAIAILYLIAAVLSACGLSAKITSALQSLATAVALCIVAFLAWKYVRNKQMVWKVLYIVLLLVVLVGIIIPLAV